MKSIILSSARASKRIVVLASVGLLLSIAGRDLSAATVVAGEIKDAVTAAPVSGADVTVTEGAVLLGQARSDQAGRFRVIFELANQAAAKNFKLGIRSSEYIEATKDVTVASGRTDEDSYQIVLFPSAVANCRRDQGHTVVIGYFRPPAGVSGQTELAGRIKDSLDYDVLVLLQEFKITPQSQPIFLACEQIKPQALVDYAHFAKVLNADAFLSGYVAAAGNSGLQKVKIDMSIADQFGFLVPPVHASSPNLDLDDPATARLQDAARIAIFTALVIGYERAGQTSECVEAANAAAKSMGNLPAVLAEARLRCARALPNSGLVR